MAETKIYQNQIIQAVKTFEKRVLESRTCQGRELSLSLENNLEEDDVLSPHPNFFLQNQETGTMYHLNRMLSGSIYGAVHAAADLGVVVGTESDILASSSAQVQSTVAVKLYLKDRVELHAGQKVLEDPRVDIGVTQYLHRDAAQTVQNNMSSEQDDDGRRSYYEKQQHEDIEVVEQSKAKRQRTDPFHSSNNPVASSTRPRCHPNIIQQIDCIETEGVLYSVLELFPGEELFEHISKHGPMPSEEAKHVLRQLLSAMSYLHSLGIVHRDIAIENILYNAKDRQVMMLIDFGMAVRLIPCPASEGHYPRQPYVFPGTTESIVSHHQHFCWLESPQLAASYICKYGKRAYVAPELFRREKPFLFHPMLCEIWTLGIILFMMLVGYPPFAMAAVSDDGYKAFLAYKLQGLLECYGVTVEPLAVDLMQKILHPNPLERLSMEQILQHEWMQSQLQ